MGFVKGFLVGGSMDKRLLGLFKQIKCRAVSSGSFENFEIAGSPYKW